MFATPLLYYKADGRARRLGQQVKFMKILMVKRSEQFPCVPLTLIAHDSYA